MSPVLKELPVWVLRQPLVTGAVETQRGGSEPALGTWEDFTEKERSGDPF